MIILLFFHVFLASKISNKIAYFYYNNVSTNSFFSSIY